MCRRITLAPGRGNSAYRGCRSHISPAWIDLRTGVVAGYAASAGMQAVMALALGAAPGLAAPHVAAAPDYYAASLIVLSRIAAVERPRAAV